jgi:hypothetical protein
VQLILKQANHIRLEASSAITHDEEASSINLRIEFVDDPMRIDPVDIEDTGTVVVYKLPLLPRKPP